MADHGHAKLVAIDLAGGLCRRKWAGNAFRPARPFPVELPFKQGTEPARFNAVGVKETRAVEMIGDRAVVIWISGICF